MIIPGLEVKIGKWPTMQWPLSQFNLGYTIFCNVTRPDSTSKKSVDCMCALFPDIMTDAKTTLDLLFTSVAFWFEIIVHLLE